MGLSVNTNIAALNAYRNLSSTQNDLSKSLEKLSSGLRINRAADDAAGLAISEGLRAQIGGTTQAVRNAQDGISVVQTAEGALTETHSILQRMRTLSVQASNDGGLSQTAKSNIQDEIGQLQTELTRISDTTTFNGKKLLDGNYSGVFQVGANTSAQDSITVDIKTAAGKGLSAAGLGVDALDITKGATTLSATTAGTAGSAAVPGSAGEDSSWTFGDGSATTEADAIAAAKTAFGLTGTYATTADLQTALQALPGKTGVTAAFTANELTISAAADSGVAGSLAPTTTVPGATYVAGTDTVDDVDAVDPTAATATGSVSADNPAGVLTFTSAAGAKTELDLSTIGSSWTADTTAAQKATDIQTALRGTFGAGSTATVNATTGAIDISVEAAPGAGAFSVVGGENAGALSAIDKIDAAITTVSQVRSSLGAVQNRFDHTINNLNVAVENLTASESRIRDTDMASEMVSYTRASILSQAGTAMLAQAKSLPQSVLQLLQ